MKSLSKLYRPAAGLALAAALILVAVGVLLGGGDPELMPPLVPPLIVIVAIMAYAKRKTQNTAYRWAVRVALTAIIILFWLIGAVGVIGVDGDPADLMYLGVLAVGIVGAIIARFQPQGMARTLFATALAQALVAVIALIAGKHQSPISSVAEIVGLNGFFVALFAGSALLFRYAAREYPSSS